MTNFQKLIHRRLTKIEEIDRALKLKDKEIERLNKLLIKEKKILKHNKQLKKLIKERGMGPIEAEFHIAYADKVQEMSKGENFLFDKIKKLEHNWTGSIFKAPFWELENE